MKDTTPSVTLQFKLKCPKKYDAPVQVTTVFPLLQVLTMSRSSRWMLAQQQLHAAASSTAMD
jgi:hypothetical protein